MAHVHIPPNIPDESAELTADIEASGLIVLDDKMAEVMAELVELTAHHLALSYSDDDDPRLNSARAYNYILENLNEVRAQGGDSPEMRQVLYELKKQMLKGEGLTKKGIRMCTAFNLARLRSRGAKV